MRCKFLLFPADRVIDNTINTDDASQCVADATAVVGNIHLCDWHAAELRGEHDESGSAYDRAHYGPPGAQ